MPGYLSLKVSEEEKAKLVKAAKKEKIDGKASFHYWARTILNKRADEVLKVKK